MRRLFLVLMATLPLAACATDTGSRPHPGFRHPAKSSTASVSSDVMGQNAAHLTRLFGRADATVSEGLGLKMQYLNDICVLDAYLYATHNSRMPVVTHIDTRQRNGAPIDPASCVAALQQTKNDR